MKMMVGRTDGALGPSASLGVRGMGSDLVEFGLVSESPGRSPLGHYFSRAQAPDAGKIEILHLYGTDKQMETYPCPLVAGEIRCCLSMTEADMPKMNTPRP